MRLGTRIFLANLVIFVVCFSYPVHWAWQNLRIRYLESVEDPLADQAHMLASLVGVQMETGRFRPDEFPRVFENINRRPVSARIYQLNKRGVDMEVYMTDSKGKVIFDSRDRKHIGEDYSRWRDVKLTLRGQYGARTTRSDPNEPASSVLYVGAPIMIKGRIAGVLTVAKPTATINDMLKGARPLFVKVFGISAMTAVVLMFLVSYALALPIRRLTRYADDIAGGRRVPLPPLNTSEIGRMGRAFEKMREALEGKKYVEKYIHTLTHEIKSPLSAIKGAAELLEEKMEPEQQARFLANIRNEAGRIQDIIDRMLELSTLENRRILDKKEKASFSSLIKMALESKQAILVRKGIEAPLPVLPEVLVEGDMFLLHQALANILQNAIDFTTRGGRIELSGLTADGSFHFIVRDFGPGIPEYARQKIFDKFFSLQRPDTGKKSTGLGLNFVREVALLHHGSIAVENSPGGGVSATLILPCTS